MDLPLSEVMQEKAVKGYLKRVNPDGTPYVEPVEQAPERPAKTAKKAEWVGWAVHNGMDPDEADAMTKDDLVEKFGGE
ncbi:hypothetical protein [Nonomuraea wenchangensis]|uniref:hypothetical protein n=1 Tax=Nonomuraea wenchangensis TaxID=568860 RepID=UPI00332B0C1D